MVDNYLQLWIHSQNKSDCTMGITSKMDIGSIKIFSLLTVAEMVKHDVKPRSNCWLIGLVFYRQVTPLCSKLSGHRFEGPSTHPIWELWKARMYCFKTHVKDLFQIFFGIKCVSRKIFNEDHSFVTYNRWYILIRRIYGHKPSRAHARIQSGTGGPDPLWKITKIKGFSKPSDIIFLDPLMGH